MTWLHKFSNFQQKKYKISDDPVQFVLEPYWSYGDRMKPYWSYGDRIKPVELTLGVDFMCGCIYGFVWSHTVSHDNTTDMAPVSGFLNF